MTKKNVGIVINVILRLLIFYFLIEVLVFPDDMRFAGKAIPIRNFLILGSLSFLFPILYFLQKKKFIQFFKSKRYPFWFDTLYLSLFVLDMAGNSLNVYNRFFWFDLLSHFHGTGAVSLVLFGVFGLGFLAALGLATIIHVLLEAQEYYTDVFFHTQNVRGIFDTVNDLLVGLLGGGMYVFIYWLLKEKSKRLTNLLTKRFK